MFDKEWKVNDITYKQKRKLWHGSISSFQGEEVDNDKYFKLIDQVEEYSGLTEKDFVKDDKTPLTMGEIDLLLQEVYTKYVGIAKKG
tara:strand:+ start:101 stop:361 length:261 start_codon:yes stop_codon:yes gene_type:complete